MGPQRDFHYLHSLELVISLSGGARSDTGSKYLHRECREATIVLVCIGNDDCVFLAQLHAEIRCAYVLPTEVARHIQIFSCSIDILWSAHVVADGSKI